MQKLNTDDLIRLLPECSITSDHVSIFRQAFMHKSVDVKNSYERLEHLGDAVLGCIVSGYLYARYPTQNEGFLTRMRTKLVNSTMLASLSKRLKFDRYVNIKSGFSITTSVLEDVFEAFVGALHLTFGFQSTEEWVKNVYETHVDFAALVKNQEHPKDVFIRHCLNRYGYKPVTVFAADGSVQFQTPQGVVMFSCEASRRGAKATEYQAAKHALQSLGVT